MEENNKEYQQYGQEGSGSAENQDNLGELANARDEQKAQHTTVGEDERNDIASQTGLDPGDVADVRETGALSGRDDAAGGSGDDLENASSNEGTERF